MFPSGSHRPDVEVAEKAFDECAKVGGKFVNAWSALMTPARKAG